MINTAGTCFTLPFSFFSHHRRFLSLGLLHPLFVSESLIGDPSASSWFVSESPTETGLISRSLTFGGVPSLDLGAFKPYMVHLFLGAFPET